LCNPAAPNALNNFISRYFVPAMTGENIQRTCV
jgi:hypothetical protein